MPYHAGTVLSRACTQAMHPHPPSHQKTRAARVRVDLCVHNNCGTANSKRSVLGFEGDGRTVNGKEWCSATVRPSGENPADVLYKDLSDS